MPMSGRRWASSNANKHNGITLWVLAAAFFLKGVLYRSMTAMDAALNAGQVAAAYLSVAAAALLLAAAVWLPRRWPAIVVLVLSDLWFLAGIWYYRANILWLTWGAVQTITELNGFADSIAVYLSWSQFFFPLLTVLAVTVLFIMPHPSPTWRERWIGVVIVLSLCLCAGLLRHMNPLTEEQRMANIQAEERYFISTHSPLAQAGLVVYDAAQNGLFRWSASRPFTSEEQAILDSVYRAQAEPNAPQGHLVYILVESFETWALQAYDRNGEAVCPHLTAYMQAHPVLFVLHVRTQQKYGRSGDGQLITQTGLLPISNGVACKQYGTNTYPNLAHFYEDGIVLNPYFSNVWNQRTVTTSYGFRRMIKARGMINDTDSIIIERARQYLSAATVPTAVLALTINTHAPFRSRRDSIALPDTYSVIEQDYLRSAHYCDRQIGRFLAWADTAATMRNATIVITADHNHFSQHGEQGLCPLILTTPEISASITIDEALQMDLYPTVLHAIGQSNYAWRGFGVDLLNNHAQEYLSLRTITPQQAYELSDKLIHNNYFAQSTR